VADPVIVKRRGRRLRAASNLRALLASVLRELEASDLPLAERVKLTAYGPAIGSDEWYRSEEERIFDAEVAEVCERVGHPQGLDTSSEWDPLLK
jgi:hypothetical protein